MRSASEVSDQLDTDNSIGEGTVDNEHVVSVVVVVIAVNTNVFEKASCALPHIILMLCRCFRARERPAAADLSSSN